MIFNYSKLIGLVWRPIAKTITLHTALLVNMDLSGYDCINVNTLGSILEVFWGLNIILLRDFSRSCLIGLVGRPIATIKTLHTTIHFVM